MNGRRFEFDLLQSNSERADDDGTRYESRFGILFIHLNTCSTVVSETISYTSHPLTDSTVQPLRYLSNQGDRWFD